jgi:serine/threonine protein kinase
VRKCGVGGNLIVTLDFFRWDTMYYKTTERIDVATFDAAEISTMPLDRRLLVLKTVVHSLDILHRQKIVHGDLKPNNVLIKKTETGNFTTKLIDFDSSFFSGDPPSAEEIVGDMVFYSPEWASYVHPDGGAAKSTLTIKSDIFALGLLYGLYMFGTLPVLAPPARYPFEAVQSAPLKVGEKVRRAVEDVTVAGRLTELLEAMLSASAAVRPSAPEVLETLKNIRRPAAKGAAGVLGGSLLKKPAPHAPGPAPKLKGSLLNKKKS